MVSVFVLSGIMLSNVMPSVIALSVFTLNAIMLCVVEPVLTRNLTEQFSLPDELSCATARLKMVFAKITSWI
jgi:hypothetical protein